MLTLIIFQRRDVKRKIILYIFEFFPYVISVTAKIVAIKTTETRELQIGLKRDGYFIDTNNTPKCGSDQIINLVSYEYHQLQCHFADDCSSVHVEPLLADEAFHLHQMCSVLHQCRNLSFPLRTEMQRNRTNAIIIRYKCIDQESLVNICEKTHRTFSDSVYLTSGDIKDSFEECQCFVDNGQFSISVADVRLNDNMENKCSPATLFVNSKEFLCNGSRSDYGAVFAKKPWKPLYNAYISLVQNSKTALPDNVLVEFQPEISLRIACQGKQKTQIINVNRSTALGRSTSTSKLPTTPAVLENDDVTDISTVPKTNCPQKGCTAQYTLLIIILALLILLYLAVLLVYGWIRCRIKSTKEKGHAMVTELESLLASRSLLETHLKCQHWSEADTALHTGDADIENSVRGKNA